MKLTHMEIYFVGLFLGGPAWLLAIWVYFSIKLWRADRLSRKSRFYDVIG